MCPNTRSILNIFSSGGINSSSSKYAMNDLFIYLFPNFISIITSPSPQEHVFGLPPANRQTSNSDSFQEIEAVTLPVV